MKWWLGWILCVLMVVGGRSAMAIAGPTCALLVDDRAEPKLAAVVAIAEARLPDSGVRLVERQAIEQALKEQELSALLGAEAVGPRVRLGHLLKADFLVILKQDAAHPGLVRLVVCESASGIRVLMRPLTLGTDPSAAAEALSKDIATAVRGGPHPTRDLCAVPPFVSKDLVYEYNAMKSAYAALAEQAATTRVGLQTVELAEARALERELALAGNPALHRPLPLYLLGEYRNTGNGDARRVSVELVLKRGQIELARQTANNLKPDEVATAIGGLVEKVFADQVPVAPGGGGIAVGREVDQLARRAGEFEQTGEWLEAADLYEAALLLDPSQKQARVKVIEAIKRLPRPNGIGQTRDQQYEAILRSHQLQRRRFAHQEAYARRFAVGPADWDLLDFSTANLALGDRRDPRVETVVIDTRLEARRIQLALIRQRLTDGNPDSLVDLLCGRDFWLQVQGERPAEGFARLLDLVTSFKDFPQARQWATRCSTHFFPVVGSGPNGLPLYAGDAEWEPYLSALEKSGSKGLREAAVDVRQELVRRHAEEAAYQARLKPASTTAPISPAAATGPAVKMRPIDVSVVFPAARKEKHLPRVNGWIPAGSGLDVLWSANNLYFMTEPGVARSVWAGSGSPHVEVETACFDGQYVWAAGRHPDGRLIVLDPKTSQTWELTKADGLLPMSSAVAITPLAPGRICVVAGFHPPEGSALAVRGWCAIVTFGSAAGGSVKVFHEALRVIGNDFKEKLATAEVGFSPAYLVTVGKGAERRLIVGRHTAANPYRCFTPPLVIDPEKLTVELWDQNGKLPGRRNGPWSPTLVQVGDTLLFSEPAFVEGSAPPPSWQPALFRASGPHAFVEPIGQLPPINFRAEGDIACAALYNGYVYFGGTRLFALDAMSGKTCVLSQAYPDGSTGCKRLAVSNHFGLITWRSGQGDRKYADDFFRIEPPQTPVP